MPQWEFLVVEEGFTGRMVCAVAANGQEIAQSKQTEIYNYINALGEQGWELVGASSWMSKHYLYFKRLKLASPERLT